MLSLLPAPQILPRLQPILSPHLQLLNSLAEGAAPDQPTRQKIIFVMKMMSTLFLTLNINRRADDQPESDTSQLRNSQGEPVDQPVFVIVKQCMPMLDKVCQNNPGDAEIIEAVCSVLKQAVSTLQDEIRPLTQDVVTLTMACYRATPQPAALDLVKQFFIMYGREAEMQGPLKSLMCEICNISLQKIQAGATMSDQADLIDCFFAMLSQVLKKQAGLFVNTELNTFLLLQCAIHTLTMPEQHPVKSAASFITQLVNVSREVETLVPLINAHGEQIFMQVCRQDFGLFITLIERFFGRDNIWVLAGLNICTFPPSL